MSSTDKRKATCHRIGACFCLYCSFLSYERTFHDLLAFCHYKINADARIQGRHTAAPQNISCIVCLFKRRDDHTTAAAIPTQGRIALGPKKNDRKYSVPVTLQAWPLARTCSTLLKNTNNDMEIK